MADESSVAATSLDKTILGAADGAGAEEQLARMTEELVQVKAKLTRAEEQPARMTE